MSENKTLFHGSDIEQIAAKFNLNKQEIISFSANINPLGLSPKTKEALAGNPDILCRYPERDYASLRQAISSYTKCPKEHITVGNGVTELISDFIQTRKPKHCLILAPTYSEYEQEVVLSGGKADYFFLEEERDFQLDITNFIFTLKRGYDLVILCNPNNPTSGILTTSELSTILEILREEDGFLMVDETYMEFAAEEAGYSALLLTNIYDNIIVFRGVSKFFAAPGLRLGYGVSGCIDVLTAIDRRRKSWAVNSVAEFAAEYLFSDRAYIAESKIFMQAERTVVCNALAAIPGLKVFPSYANFVLVKITDSRMDAERLFEILIRKKMMIRNCSSFNGLGKAYFRACFMQSPENRNMVLAIEDAMTF